MAIRDNYVTIRRFMNKTATEIQEATGISKQNLSNWENGISNPGTAFIDQLSKYFDIPHELFYRHNLTEEDLKAHFSIKKPTREENEAAVSEKDKIMKALQDAMAEGSSYMVIPKTVIDGEYRIVPEREYIMREREIGIREKEQEESNKAMDVMVKYIANLERDNAELNRENADLRSQIAPPMPPQG